MSRCVVPSWNLRRQRQEQVEGEERNRSSHVHTQLQKPSRLVPMSNCEVTELTWENGQLAMHGLCGPGLLPTKQSKPTGDTLESIVHQATCQKPKIPSLQRHQNHANFSSIVASSSGGSRGKWTEISSGQGRSAAFGSIEKSTRTNFDHCGRKFSSSIEGDWLNQSVCESASADHLCRENDTTMMTWPSFESPCSLKTKTTDEDSACCHGGSENQDEEQETKCETGRSNSTRRSRAAAVHNQSERKRRDRINQKMKALQKLVPNASKTDKASMLDEVIDYLKQLQAQIQMMSAARNMSQTVVPAIGQMQQYHHQMSVLARMGMSGVGLGMGMGMLDMSSLAGMARPPPHSLFPLVRPTAPATAAAAAPTFVPPPFVLPSNASVHMHDSYCALLAQSMNMDLYNKMAALYQQQVNQTTQATNNPSQTSHVQGD